MLRGDKFEYLVSTSLCIAEFRRYVQMQVEWRNQWQSTVTEAQRLQRELDRSLQAMADLETKLFHARRLLEMESKARRAAESERDAFVSNLNFHLFFVVISCISYLRRKNVHKPVMYSTMTGISMMRHEANWHF